MKKDGLISTFLNIIFFSLVIIAATIFFVYDKKWIGFVFVIIGLLDLATLRIFGVKTNTLWPDIVFGAVDNGVLAIGAIIGADFAGVLGAIIGSCAANTVTDGLAGLFEGETAEFLRKKGVKEKKTALSSSLGKMAGCLFGAGLVFIVLWSIFSL